MASTFLDLFVAKVAIQLGLLDPPGAAAALRAVDQGQGGLVEHLRERLAVAPDVAARVEGHARRCLFLKGEAFYLRFLRERRWVDDERLKPLLWNVRAHPADGRDVRLGDLLVAQRLLSTEQDQQVEAQAREALDRDNDGVTARYRQRGYVGIEQNSQTVAEVIAAAATVEAQPASQVASAPEATPSGVTSGARAARAELMGDLALSREATPAVALDERTSELAAPITAPEHDTARFAAPELARTGLHEKYHIGRKLGEGGMGAVYLAHAKDDDARERPLALKVVLDVAKSKDAAARFKREILATSMCAHENIIEIHDGGETDDGSFYMAMEYLAGEQLDEVLKREGPLSVPRVVDFVEQALEGLAAVHQANIVHRDIKPQNFRIWRDEGGRERLKIMDFGIARILDAEDSGAGDQFYMTMAGKITGSPAYIAPECIVNESLDGRADLYSLGVAIFRIATGRLPFVAKTPDEFLPMHLYKKPPPLRELLPDAPAELEAFTGRLLEKAPTKRFASADEALVDLRQKVRPALLGAAPTTMSTAATSPSAAAPGAADDPNGLETTTPDRGAVAFTPAPGAGDQVRPGGELTPPREPLPHEVAVTAALGPDEAAGLQATNGGALTPPVTDAPPAAAPPATAPHAAAPEVATPRADAPGAHVPASTGKGKLVLVAALIVVLLLVGAAATAAVVLSRGA